MTKALVIGANGQDGSFLVRRLIEKKYCVFALARQERGQYGHDSPLFSYFRADLRQSNVLFEPLNQFRPDLIFHVAAVHTSAGGDYESHFDDVLKVNVGSVHTVLEHLRRNPDCRLVYASSAKVFGNPFPARIDELTPKKNQCLYSISKNSAYHAIDYYRKKYGIKAAVVYLFNHESELRPKNFFIPTILNSVVAASRNPCHVTGINTLNFHCDWGSAEEYMDIVTEIIEKYPFEDFVLATGKCTYARDLVSRLFNKYGLNYKDHIKERLESDDSPSNPYMVDLSKLERLIKRRPCVDIYDVCTHILAYKYGL